MKDYLIFSDLDGTLLDHNDYTFEQALPALDWIKKKNIPLILASSKTYEEMLQFQSKLTIDHPFIFENGSGIHYQKKIIQFGFNLSLIHDKIDPLKREFNFYSKLNVEEAIKLTGLSRQQAKASQNRLFSDPIIWLDREEKQYEFINIVSELGFNVIKGGRFLTICSHHDKSNALKWIKNEYEKQHETSFLTIGLGDGENDIKMIEASDIKILIKNNNDHLKQSNWIFSRQTGPKGWNDELLKVLKNE